jgi:hypothetical protein
VGFAFLLPLFGVSQLKSVYLTECTYDITNNVHGGSFRFKATCKAGHNNVDPNPELDLNQ